MPAENAELDVNIDRKTIYGKSPRHGSPKPLKFATGTLSLNEEPTEPESQVSPPAAGWGAKGRFFAFLAVGVGVLAGLGLFTFGYGQGASYLSNDPKGCVNCHVMQGHFDSWEQSSHRHVAVCNDCHLPHHPIGKWVTKADNGFFHSLAFTLENFHEPIQIKPRNRRVTQGACLHCHADFVHNMLPAETGGGMLNCIHCHSDVGHAFKD